MEPVGTFWPRLVVVSPGNSQVNESSQMTHRVIFTSDATSCPPLGDWQGYGAVFSCTEK